MRGRLKRLKFSFSLTPSKIKKAWRRLQCRRRGYHDWPSDPYLRHDVGCLRCGRKYW